MRRLKPSHLSLPTELRVLKRLVSLADIVAKLQHVPQGDWFLTEVTVPRFLRSNFAGNESAFDFQ